MIVDHRFYGTVADYDTKKTQNNVIVFISSLIWQKERNKDALKSKLS